MTTQPLNSIEEPEPRAWPHPVLASAATLAALGLIASVLIWPGGRAPERQTAASAGGQERPAMTATGSTAVVEKGGLAALYDDQSGEARRAGSAAMEKGGLAELYDDLGQARTRASRVTVYLVASEAEAEEFHRIRAMAAREDGALPVDDLVLVMGTVEQRARAEVILQDLGLSARGSGTHIVDLRRPSQPDSGSDPALTQLPRE